MMMLMALQNDISNLIMGWSCFTKIKIWYGFWNIKQ